RTKGMGVAGSAGGEQDGGSRDSRLAEVEGVAAASDPAPDHYQSRFRSADRVDLRLLGYLLPGGVQFIEASASKQCSGSLAALARPIRNVGRGVCHHLPIKCLL